ncbi:uncharacterized protein MJAP1_000137 [Malassezia japonica]|uniref:Uncharacterized protein n=1 Tax=Malassezia japonica TaxID=223818 RepID=A0AAF0EUP8_9BASI|nr:uncharacterized protein MJAP1_000137 [Malassezia japonica]WFD37195.1 hypothetical protein MJAP1_000137 [Malassezia japonica]
MVLMILVNIGQLTDNIVSKSIYISKVSPVMSSIFSNGDNTPSVRGQNSPLLSYDPVQAVTGEVGVKYNSALDPIQNDLSSIHTKSVAGMYLLFVGTILIGVAFLITCLVHFSALVIAAFFAFLAFALLASGASLWTYVIYHVRDIVGNTIDYQYASRKRYYEEPYY